MTRLNVSQSLENKTNSCIFLCLIPREIMNDKMHALNAVQVALNKASVKCIKALCTKCKLIMHGHQMKKKVPSLLVNFTHNYKEMAIITLN